MSLGDIVSRTDLILRKCVIPLHVHTTCAVLSLRNEVMLAVFQGGGSDIPVEACRRYEKYAAKPDGPADRPQATGADKFTDEYVLALQKIEELSTVSSVSIHFGLLLLVCNVQLSPHSIQ